MNDVVLEARSVTARRGGRDVVSGVDLTLRSGHVLAVVGPNGAGKSTLLHALVTGDCAGSILWQGGHDRDLARRVAVLAQTPSWAAGETAWDAVLVGRSPHRGGFGLDTPRDVHAARQAADWAGVTPLLERDMETLSGGERQRVFLARAAAQIWDAPYAAVLLDEPDAHLDLPRRVQLVDLVRSLARRNVALLVVSHDLAFADDVSDDVLVLRDGGVVAVGPGEVTLTADVLSTAYGLDVAVARVAGRLCVVATRDAR